MRGAVILRNPEKAELRDFPDPAPRHSFTRLSLRAIK